MTHRPEAEPGLDSAREKHLQHKVRIQNTTSLQTSPSRQFQELTGPAHHTTRWLQQDRIQHIIQCRVLQNDLCGPFPKLLPPLSRSRRSWSSQALGNCVTIAVYSVSFLFPAKTICRSSRDWRPFWRSRYLQIFELKESLTSLSCRHVASINVSSSSTTSVDRGVSRGDLMIVTSCTRFLVSRVPDTSESLGHLAKITLLSHDVVSDDFSWSTSDLIIRQYFLVSVRHRHRCERAFSQNTKEALNSSYIFKVLRFAHSNHFFRRSPQISPQTSHRPFLFTRFQTSSGPQPQHR